MTCLTPDAGRPERHLRDPRWSRWYGNDDEGLVDRPATPDVDASGSRVRRTFPERLTRGAFAVAGRTPTAAGGLARPPRRARAAHLHAGGPFSAHPTHVPAAHRVVRLEDRLAAKWSRPRTPERHGIMAGRVRVLSAAKPCVVEGLARRSIGGHGRRRRSSAGRLTTTTGIARLSTKPMSRGRCRVGGAVSGLRTAADGDGRGWLGGRRRTPSAVNERRQELIA